MAHCPNCYDGKEGCPVCKGTGKVLDHDDRFICVYHQLGIDIILDRITGKKYLKLYIGDSGSITPLLE